MRESQGGSPIGKVLVKVNNEKWFYFLRIMDILIVIEKPGSNVNHFLVC